MKIRKILLSLLVLCAILILTIVVYGYTTYTSVVTLDGEGTDTDSFHTAIGKDNNNVWWTLDYEARAFITTSATTDVIFSVYPSSDPGDPDIYKRSQELGPTSWQLFSYGDENAQLSIPDEDYTTKLEIPYSYFYNYRDAVGVVSNIAIEQ